MNLADRAWSLLARGLEVYADNPRACHWLGRYRTRFSEPVRIAVVGPAGTGGSTLVAALTGREAVSPGTWQHVPGGHRRPSLLLLDTSAGERGDDPRSAEAVSAEADAVLYLLDQPHDPELTVLRAVHDRAPVRLAPVNALAVLARADEVGGGRVDAVVSARRVARRCARDGSVAAVCQDVVAVAGLTARAGGTLREAEFELLAGLAAAPESELEPLLLSADRFGADPERSRLLARFGLHGIRVATTLLRRGVGTVEQLSAELCRRSGLDSLHEALRAYFVDRALVLKARSALLGLDVVLRREPRPAAAGLVTELERTLTGAHEFAELRLFSMLRTGRVSLPGDLGEEAVRLVGGYGDAPRSRLGLDSPEPGVRQAAVGALRAWRSYAENPVLGSAERHAATTVVRTCEALVTEPLS